VIALCAVALSAVLLLPDVCSAQRFGRGGRFFGGGRGNYSRGYPYTYGGYGWSGPYGGATFGGYFELMPGTTYPFNTQPYTYTSPIVGGNVVSSQSAYPPDGRNQGTIDRTRALIDVHVPPNAQVFFDNSPTQQRGSERRFMTPPLDPNSKYTYNVEARWTDQDGQEQRENRTVRLTPGETTDVNFTAPQNTQNPNESRQQPRQE
jgi:uncharacterized protein (TIGR03000 family)